jgi:hypothetical protein
MLTGAPVIGFDGERVGTMVEGNQLAIRVRMPSGEDVWLKSDAVLDTSDGRVTLICYARGVTRWVVE